MLKMFNNKIHNFKNKRILGLITILLLLGVFAFNFQSTKGQDEFPESPQNFYYDETATLNSTTQQMIQQKNLFYKSKSKSPQVVVAVIKSTNDDDIDSYAPDIFKKWRIGNKDEDNGILILYALNNGKRNVRIEVGYGLEGELTDSLAGQILRDNKIDLKSNSSDQVNKGLQAVFKSVCGVIDSKYGYKTSDVKYGNSYLEGQNKGDNTSNNVVLQLIIVIVFVFFIAVLANIKPRVIHQKDGSRHSILWWILWILFWNNNHRGGGSSGFWDGGTSGSDFFNDNNFFDGGGGSSGGGGASI